ncbi:hypothetical protein ACE6H2_002997 [Prunus campanulata]
MGEANEERSRAMEYLSLQIDKYPRDLLQRLMCSSNTQQSQYAEPSEEEESDELELNLGLSLGGRFGVDKSSKKKLIRSSSIAGTMPFVRDDNDPTTPAQVSCPASLMRTSSLPTETEEEWRKRKELQTLRRLEAKRRRSEKQRNSNPSKAEKEGVSLEEERRELEGGPNLRDKQQQPYDGASRVNRTVGLPFVLPSWAAAAAARQASVGGGVDALEKLKAEILGSLQGFGGQPTSQGSMESQGGSSSGMSELESKPLQGSSNCGEARSPASNHLLQERSNQDTVGSSGTGTAEDASRASRADVESKCKKPNSSEKSGRETRTNAMEDMPCVFTKGDGPNGRKVEGILYRYGKGEEVRIMCVCHGSFLSPAEFVKHAGGSDVTHPLRHIVVNPAATSFL